MFYYIIYDIYIIKYMILYILYIIFYYMIIYRTFVVLFLLYRYYYLLIAARLRKLIVDHLLTGWYPQRQIRDRRIAIRVVAQGDVLESDLAFAGPIVGHA